MRKAIPVSIPPEWRFSDLQLARDTNGDVHFSLEALQAVLADPADLEWLLSHSEEHVSELLARLYDYAVEHLGAEDPVAERIIAEIREESE